MRKRYISIVVLLVPIAAVLMAGSGSLRSDGAPVSSTGAPQESTCAVSGCHSDIGVNKGGAMPEILIDGKPAAYEPGKTYKITTRISDPEKVRFGFQLVALSNNDQINAGKLEVIDATRTQILKNYLELKDRDYMTYTYPGTEAIKNGLGEWSFNWTAPVQDIGPVKFYAAFASANNDKTDKGDHIYTKELMLGAPASTGMGSEDIPVKYNFTARADKSAQAFEIRLAAHKAGKTVVKAYDLNGRAVTEPTIVKLDNGTTSVNIPWIRPLSKGIYLISVEMGNKLETKKVTVQ